VDQLQVFRLFQPFTTLRRRVPAGDHVARQGRQNVLGRRGGRNRRHARERPQGSRNGGGGPGLPGRGRARQRGAGGGCVARGRLAVAGHKIQNGEPARGGGCPGAIARPFAGFRQPRVNFAGRPVAAAIQVLGIGRQGRRVVVLGRTSQCAAVPRSLAGLAPQGRKIERYE
jgi:hypothetical protein